MPGDAGKLAEYSVLAENESTFLHADVLKVGHHGRKNSTVPASLDAVAPQIAIISAGEENPYGHPSPELLERWQGGGSRVLRTDQDGEVQVLTDGRDLRASCFVACPERAVASGRAQPPEKRQDNQQ